jgi:hypothetical protein
MAFGCGNKGDTNTANSNSKTAASGAKTKAGAKTNTTKPTPAKPVAAVKLDPEVANVVKSARDCDLINKAYKCEANKAAIKVVKGLLKDKKRIVAILDTLSAMANDADPKTATAARFYVGQLKNLYLLPKVVRAKVSISGATATRLIDALSKTNNKLAPRMGFAVAGVAGLTGKIDEAVNMAKAHKNPKVYASVIEHLMTYGRMKAFGAVKAAAASDKGKVRAAALQAARNMSKWSATETGTLCPWAKPFLGDKKLKVAANAAHLMVKCKLVDKGAYIDAMLAEGKKRVAAGEWKKPFIWAFRDVCFGGMIGTVKKPAEATCQKTYDFLETVANNDKVGGWLRGFAL